MRADPRLLQIEQARRVVIDNAGSATDAMVQAWYDRAWLERSWRRCLAQGQRPEQRVGFDLVPANTPRHVAEAHQPLLAAARPELERLARAVAPIRYFAILTDAEGTVVDTAGAIDRADRRADAIARVGVDLSERSIGTSACSMGFSLGAPCRRAAPSGSARPRRRCRRGDRRSARSACADAPRCRR